jgi:dinuclear metal center YbgI/SA1388 family protein
MTRKKTVSLDRLSRYLNDYLSVADIPDDSMNGLQVEGAARISKAAFAVDACQASFRAAARAGAEILIVHHGLFWGKMEPIAGIMKKRLSTLFENGLSLYAVHLPLDCHPEVGNNTQLAALLGLINRGKFAAYKSTEIGVMAEPLEPLERRKLRRRIEQQLNAPADLLPFGPDRIRRIGIVSGGGDFAIGEAEQMGCDTLLTGETSHQVYHLAEERKLNVIFAGHYATETVGLKALAAHVSKRFAIECRFLAAPTGY